MWNPDASFWLDVEAFERFCLVPGRLVDAVFLYQGDLLETLYEDWIIYERERLREEYFTALTCLIEDNHERCNYGEAIRYAQTLLRHDPFRENVLRQLIALLYESGDRSSAICEYEQFNRLLHRELGVNPMPETQAVFEAVVHNARLPGVHSTPAQGDRKRSWRWSLPFCGREGEIEQLQVWLGQATHGYGRVVLVGGEAGIGKTRLARELALTAETLGVRILYGSTSPAHSRPYQAISEAFNTVLPLIGSLEIEPVWMAALGLLIPGINNRKDLATLPALDPRRERMRLFEAAARCLEALAGPRPVLLILEDLHWAGEDSIALVEFLARRIWRTRLLLLVTYREEEVTRVHPLRRLRRLQHESLIERLPLARLSRQAVTSLLSQTPEMQPFQEDMVEQLFQDSEGNPLFLDLLVQQKIWMKNSQRDSLHRCEGWASGFGQREEEIPASLRKLIDARLTQLSSPARQLAEVAAVIGKAFDVEIVREVTGWDERRTLDALGELLDHHLVRETDSRSYFDYVFAHHLIQSSIYDQISVAMRRRRHRRIALVIEELYPERQEEFAGELGWHKACSDQPEKAAQSYLEAAQAALNLFAEGEALHYLFEALALTCVDSMRFQLLALREEIYHRQGARREQRADLENMGQIATRKGEPEMIRLWLLREIRQKRVLGERQAESHAVEQLKALADQLPDSSLQADAF